MWKRFYKPTERGLLLKEMGLELDSEGWGRGVGRWIVTGTMAGRRERRLESELGRIPLVIYICGTYHSKSEGLKTINIVPHKCRGSGIQECLSWTVLAQGFSGGSVKISARAAGV